jgi:hypothetical protein
MFLVRKIGAWGYEEFHSRPEADVYANRTTECVMCDEHLGVERGVFLTVSLNLNSDDMYLQPVHFACTAAFIEAVNEVRHAVEVAETQAWLAQYNAFTN